MKSIRIGTRRSALALWQACYVRDLMLRHHPGCEVRIVRITTSGDRSLTVPLATVGGKGLFLKELEQALLDRRIDLAVHSMKDVTVQLPPGLHIGAICERGDAHDALVSNHCSQLADLPPGARVGTCSLRRQCLLRHYYPQLAVENLRGNVNTRLARLDGGDFDALILAAAGLRRLALAARIAASLPTDQFVPAVGQGAVGIECRIDDAPTQQLLAPLHHAASAARVAAERAANERLNGGCHVPLAVFAHIHAQTMRVTGLVGEPDGSRLLHAEATGPVDQPVLLGIQVAEALLAQGAGEVLARLYGEG